MPYISIKCWPKDKATEQTVVERINQVFLEEWGCPPQALTIALEEVNPEDWQDAVVKPEIEPRREHMMILSGEKLYE